MHYSLSLSLSLAFGGNSARDSRKDSVSSEAHDLHLDRKKACEGCSSKVRNSNAVRERDFYRF